MGRPRQVTNEQILSTTRECVLELGPQVSLDTVAERLGVTSPALLKRFKSRQALMLESLRPPARFPFQEDLERGPDPGAPFEPQLEALLVRLYDFFSEMVPRISALRESGIPHAKFFNRGSNPMVGIRAVTTWLDQAIAAGLAKTDASESAATAIMGAVTTRAFIGHWMHHPYSTRSNREYLKDITQLFCRALSASTLPPRRKSPRPRSNRQTPESS